MNNKEEYKNKARDTCLNYLLSLGLSYDEAQYTLNSLIYAEAHGKTTHGLNRLLSDFIKKQVVSGTCESYKEPFLTKKDENSLLYDGNFSLGYYGIHKIIDDILENYSYKDIIFAHIKNLYPTNCLSEYVERFCNENYICFITSKSPNKVSPPIILNEKIKNIKTVVGTNAYAWGFPSNNSHIIFDTTMASSTNGELLNLLKSKNNNFNKKNFLTKNFTFPKRYNDLFDKENNFTGYILPFGLEKNYKGFGNLLVAELFNLIQSENILNTSTTIIAIKVNNIDFYSKQLEKFVTNFSNSIEYQSNIQPYLPNSKKSINELDIFWNNREIIDEIEYRMKNKNYKVELLKTNIKNVIEFNTPGYKLFQKIKNKKIIKAFGISTPLHAMILEDKGIDTGWISSFEVSSFLGNRDDESTPFKDYKYLIDKILIKCPNMNIIVDCDTGFSSDEKIMSQYFRSLSSKVSCVVIQNTKTGLKQNSFSKSYKIEIESPKNMAKKLNIISKNCKNVLICLRLENIISGESIESTIAYIKEIKKFGGKFDIICPHSKDKSDLIYKEFSEKLHKTELNYPLITIPTACITNTNIIQKLENYNYNIIILANHTLRTTYHTINSTYDKLIQNNFSINNMSSMHDIIDFIDLKNNKKEVQYNMKDLEIYKKERIIKILDNLSKTLNINNENKKEIRNILFKNTLKERHVFFDNWLKDTYELNKLPDHSILMNRLNKSCSFKETDYVLDVGCGPGSSLPYISNIKTIVCLDFSKEMINTVKQKVNDYNYNIHPICDDIMKYNESKNKFDKIFSIMSLHHIEHDKKQQVLNKIYELLKPNGYFFLGETFFDTYNIDSKDTINEICELYEKKIFNCLNNECTSHAVREIHILKKILFSEGEYMLSLSAWKDLLQLAGFEIIKSEITSPFIKYGYILLKKSLKK